MKAAAIKSNVIDQSNSERILDKTAQLAVNIMNDRVLHTHHTEDRDTSEI